MKNRHSDFHALSDSQTNLSRFSTNTARFSQVIVLIGTLFVIAGMFARPEPTERILWSILIPVLPASFLISPSLWRSVCPLATLNMLGNGTVSSIRVSKEGLMRAEVIGIILLFTLVPARRFVLNENGPVLGILIIAIAATALILGFFYASKGGFCNSICPVLPVEKLYGQNPLINIKNPRCQPCDACTLKGCYDLDPAKSIAFALRKRSSKKDRWDTTVFGLFASGFPGFIVGYFTVTDSLLSSAVVIYAQIFGYAILSGIVVHALYRLLRIRTDYGLLILGAVSVALYYWFMGPAIANTFALDPAVGTGIRVVTLTLVGIWVFRGMRGISSRTSARVPSQISVSS